MSTLAKMNPIRDFLCDRLVDLGYPDYPESFQHQRVVYLVTSVHTEYR